MAHPEDSPFTNRLFYSLVAAGVLVNATGLFPPILEPDGALYATIAKTMAQSGDFVNLYAVDADWLDKPHFPFWVSAVSYRIFGINTFAYKFPALLFFMGGVVYTYRFARLMYSKTVAQVAALVLLTAFHGVLSNSDVRAEPYLTGLVIGAVYHFYRLYDPTPTPPLKKGGGAYWRWFFFPVSRESIVHLLLGALLTGCALMTKGVFVLVPIGSGLVTHWLLTGQWRELLKLRWYVAIALSFAFTLPEIYCLYEQFDRHPEKVIFGQTGVSGVRFFFWDSQFGRFFNTGPIKGQGDTFFFVHTLLWAFLPWSLPLYVGVGKALAGLVRQKEVVAGVGLPEYVSLGSGLATFALFSLSGFQLPHYMNIVFPFFAILTAQFLAGLNAINLRRWTIGQTVIGTLVIVLSVGLLLLVQPMQLGLALGWAGVITVALFRLFRVPDLLSLTGRMVGAMLVLMGVLNLFIFPTLFVYEAGMTAARFANTQPALDKRPVILYEPGTGVGGGSFWTYQFYAEGSTPYARTDSALKARLQATPGESTPGESTPGVVFTTAAFADSLAGHGFRVRQLAAFPYYHVSRLTYLFLNHDTRAKTVEPYVLVEVR